MNIYSKCPRCKQNKWFVRARDIHIPTKGKATSRDQMCRACYKGLQDIIVKMLKS